VGVDVTAQGNPRCAIRSDGVAVKVTHQPGQPHLVERVNGIAVHDLSLITLLTLMVAY
jgi:hypothetical protein